MKGSFWKNATVLVLATLLTLPLRAQTQDPAVTYNNGKVLLQQQRYDLAMRELLPLTNSLSESLYAPEASYLYALAALKSHKLKEAYDMLLSLENQHPKWGGLSDADYLLANVLFEQGEYERALSKLQELEGSEVSGDAESLKRYYLVQLNNRVAYEQLFQRFPNDKTLAQIYADKLLSGWYRPQDKRTLENIVARFNLDRSRYLSKDALSNKGYKVALLLPFQLNQDMQQTARKSQFVTDMYAGMQLAQDSLQKQGVAINLFTYDTSADTMSVKRVLDMPELKQMDLVIGPIYKSTAKVAARFAAQNNINVINPLSQDIDMVQGNSNAFLFESSVATQARQAANYAYQNFSPKTAIILFENTKEDTTFAYYYRQQFQKLGGKVKNYKKINSAQTTATAATFNGLNLQDVGHMAVFSDRMTTAANATSLLQGKAPKLPLVTYDKWLDINQITLRQLDDLEVYFISPKYVNKQNPAYESFRRKYISKYNIPPSVYAYAGFEMLYYFGNQLQNYGPQFNQQLAESGIRPGILYPGVGYADPGSRNQIRQDNQYVPITKLDNLQLSIVNPVY
ncbi:ABC transporter substrate-binding protein [Pontibacter sp. MBLB2868]|uniref:ABC transporter substrate-binding protein n=1 Tax=Pontibacter sp. MBLB2868 TaxID=3451555 RepID=UPI003F74D54E